MNIPEKVGPYTIIKVIGEGGMGVVCLAHQSEPVRRSVALKILKSPADSKQVLARFEAERQALAVMEHPAIVKVFDAGITDDGHPYVVMDRVSGIPITDYCDERRLTIRERIELFIEACRAVQHAHSKGIIHRDLKPNHVLVSDSDGRAMIRIIDFGIAKAMGTADFEGVHLFYGEDIVGTPQYMSPEQIQGIEDVDTRSDIYSLGVMLYELLVGALPYEQDERPGWSAIAAHLLEEPPTPTQRLSALSDTQDTIAQLRRTTPVALRKELRTDLDWIVSRTMDRNRARRYETAIGLANDLERYLAMEPVRARDGGAAYRLGKFARRNRLAVAFVATVAAGLVTLTATSIQQANRTAAARDEADARRAQAESLIDFMLSDLWEKLEPIGRLEVLDDVGEQATAYFSRVPPELYSDAELAARSKALYRIGDVRLDQGRLPEAQRAFDESLRLARALSVRDPDSEEWLFGLGQAEFWVGESQRRQGHLDQALERFQAYRDVSDRLAEADPQDPTYILEVGFSHANVGAILYTEGRYEQSLVEYAASLRAKELAVRLEPSSRARLSSLAEDHNKIGMSLRDLGRLDEAGDHFEKELEIRADLVSRQPENAALLHRLATTHHFMGELLHRRGDLSGAIRRFENHREILEPLSRGDPTNLTWRRSLAAGSVRLGHVLLDHGEAEEALRMARMSVGSLAELVRLNPEQTNWQSDLANARLEFARALLESNRLEDAISQARDAAEITIRVASAGWTRQHTVAVARAELLVSDAQALSGQTELSRETCRTALNRLEGMEHPGTDIYAELARAACYDRTGRSEEALTLVMELADMGFALPELTTLMSAHTDAGNHEGRGE
jgi:serine/threonine-protein kinase